METERSDEGMMRSGRGEVWSMPRLDNLQEIWNIDRGLRKTEVGDG